MKIPQKELNQYLEDYKNPNLTIEQRNNARELFLLGTKLNK